MLWRGCRHTNGTYCQPTSKSCACREASKPCTSCGNLSLCRNPSPPNEEKVVLSTNECNSVLVSTSPTPEPVLDLSTQKTQSLIVEAHKPFSAVNLDQHHRHEHSSAHASQKGTSEPFRGCLPTKLKKLSIFAGAEVQTERTVTQSHALAAHTEKPASAVVMA